jgi:hypothetical protein
LSSSSLLFIGSPSSTSSLILTLNFTLFLLLDFFLSLISACPLNIFDSLTLLFLTLGPSLLLNFFIFLAFIGVLLFVGI